MALGRRGFLGAIAAVVASPCLPATKPLDLGDAIASVPFPAIASLGSYKKFERVVTYVPFAPDYFPLTEHGVAFEWECVVEEESA